MQHQHQPQVCQPPTLFLKRLPAVKQCSRTQTTIPAAHTVSLHKLGVLLLLGAATVLLLGLPSGASATATESRSQSASQSTSTLNSVTASGTTAQSTTASPSWSASISLSGSPSPSPAGSPSESPTNGESISTTDSPSPTNGDSGTPSGTTSQSVSASASWSASPEWSDSPSPSPSGSPSPSPSGSPSESPTNDESVSTSTSETHSVSPSASPTPSKQLPVTPTATASHSSSVSHSASPSTTGTISKSSSASASSSVSASVSRTASGSQSASISVSTSPSSSATHSASQSASSSTSQSTSPSQTHSASPSASPTPSKQLPATPTTTASHSSSASRSVSASASGTKTKSASASLSGSNTASHSSSSSLSSTASNSVSPRIPLSFSLPCDGRHRLIVWEAGSYELVDCVDADVLLEIAASNVSISIVNSDIAGVHTVHALSNVSLMGSGVSFALVGCDVYVPYDLTDAVIEFNDTSFAASTYALCFVGSVVSSSIRLNAAALSTSDGGLLHFTGPVTSTAVSVDGCTGDPWEYFVTLQGSWYGSSLSLANVALMVAFDNLRVLLAQADVTDSVLEVLNLTANGKVGRVIDVDIWTVTNSTVTLSGYVASAFEAPTDTVISCLWQCVRFGALSNTTVAIKGVDMSSDDGTVIGVFSAVTAVALSMSTVVLSPSFGSVASFSSTVTSLTVALEGLVETATTLLQFDNDAAKTTISILDADVRIDSFSSFATFNFPAGSVSVTIANASIDAATFLDFYSEITGLVVASTNATLALDSAFLNVMTAFGITSPVVLLTNTTFTCQSTWFYSIYIVDQPTITLIASHISTIQLIDASSSSLGVLYVDSTSSITATSTSAPLLRVNSGSFDHWTIYFAAGSQLGCASVCFENYGSMTNTTIALVGATLDVAAILQAGTWSASHLLLSGTTVSVSLSSTISPVVASLEDGSTIVVEDCNIALGWHGLLNIGGNAAVFARVSVTVLNTTFTFRTASGVDALVQIGGTSTLSNADVTLRNITVSESGATYLVFIWNFNDMMFNVSALNASFATTNMALAAVRAEGATESLNAVVYLSDVHLWTTDTSPHTIMLVMTNGADWTNVSVSIEGGSMTASESGGTIAAVVMEGSGGYNTGVVTVERLQLINACASLGCSTGSEFVRFMVPLTSVSVRLQCMSVAAVDAFGPPLMHFSALTSCSINVEAVMVYSPQALGTLMDASGIVSSSTITIVYSLLTLGSIIANSLADASPITLGCSLYTPRHVLSLAHLDSSLHPNVVSLVDADCPSSDFSRFTCYGFITPSASLSTSASSSNSASHSASASPSSTHSKSPSASASPSNTSVDSASTSHSPSTTASPSPTASVSASSSASRTQTTTASDSISHSDSSSRSLSLSGSTSVSTSRTESTSVSGTGSTSLSLSLTRSLELPATPTATFSGSASTTASHSRSTSGSLTRSTSPTFSASPSGSTSPSSSATGSHSDTSSGSSSHTPSTSVSGTGSTSPSLSLTRSLELPATPTATFSGSASTTASHSRSTSGSLTRSTSPTFSASPSGSTSPSSSATGSHSDTSSGSSSHTPSTSVSGTGSTSPSLSPTPSLDPPATPTATMSSSGTADTSVSNSITGSITQSTSPTFSASPSSSGSLSSSETEQRSDTSSVSMSLTASMSVSRTDSVSPSLSPTSSLDPPATPTATMSSSGTADTSVSNSITGSITQSTSPTFSASPSSSGSLSSSETEQRSDTSSDSSSQSPSLSVSGSLTMSLSASPTSSIQPPPTPTATVSLSPTATRSASSSGTASPSRTGTPTITSSSTASQSDTQTVSQSPTTSASSSTTVSKPTPTLSATYDLVVPYHLSVFRVDNSNGTVNATSTSFWRAGGEANFRIASQLWAAGDNISMSIRPYQPDGTDYPDGWYTAAMVAYTMAFQTLPAAYDATTSATGSGVVVAIGPSAYTWWSLNATRSIAQNLTVADTSGVLSQSICRQQLPCVVELSAGHDQPHDDGVVLQGTRRDRLNGQHRARLSFDFPAANRSVNVAIGLLVGSDAPAALYFEQDEQLTPYRAGTLYAGAGWSLVEGVPSPTLLLRYADAYGAPAYTTYDMAFKIALIGIPNSTDPNWNVTMANAAATYPQEDATVAKDVALAQDGIHIVGSGGVGIPTLASLLVATSSAKNWFVGYDAIAVDNATDPITVVKDATLLLHARRVGADTATPILPLNAGPVHVVQCPRLLSTTTLFQGFASVYLPGVLIHRTTFVDQASIDAWTVYYYFYLPQSQAVDGTLRMEHSRLQCVNLRTNQVSSPYRTSACALKCIVSEATEVALLSVSAATPTGSTNATKKATLLSIVRALTFVAPTSLLAMRVDRSGSGTDMHLPCRTTMGYPVTCMGRSLIIPPDEGIVVPAASSSGSAATTMLPCVHVALAAESGAFAQLATATLTLDSITLWNPHTDALIDPTTEGIVSMDAASVRVRRVVPSFPRRPASSLDANASATYGTSSGRKRVLGTPHEFSVCGIVAPYRIDGGGLIDVRLTLGFVAHGSAAYERQRSVVYPLAPLNVTFNGALVCRSRMNTLQPAITATSSSSDVNTSCCRWKNNSNPNNNASTVVDCSECLNPIILPRPLLVLETFFASSPVAAANKSGALLRLDNAATTYFGLDNRVCRVVASTSSGIVPHSDDNTSFSGNASVSIDVVGCVARTEGPTILDARNAFYGSTLDVYATTVAGDRVVLRSPPLVDAKLLTPPPLWQVVPTPRIVHVAGCPMSVFPGTADCPIAGGSEIVLTGHAFSALFPNDATTLLDNATISVVPSSDVPPEVRHLLDNISVTVQFSDTFATIDESATVTTSRNVSCLLTVVALYIDREQQIRCMLQEGYGTGGIVHVVSRHAATLVASISSKFGLVSFENSKAYLCPLGDNTLLCSGNGVCEAATGTCSCYASVGTGYWGGADCSLCHVAFNQSAGCIVRCPEGDNGLVCSGAGQCASGVCTCDNGYGGLSCELVCPGLATPCSGSGICSRVDGTCACFNDTTLGHFAGDDCGVCQDTWSGARCDQQCPKHPSSGLLCSGQGRCFEGDCYCNATYCGPACEYLRSATSAAVCDSCLVPTLYGADCDRQCPGTLSPQIPCNGNGVCSSGQDGSGLCLCNDGFALTDCGGVCPRDGNTGAICGGALRGTCVFDTATCTCFPTFAGPSCSIACPTHEGVLCNGHGYCDSGASGSGLCRCDPYYAGAACNVTCTGAAPVCAGHGLCQPTGYCSCFDDSIGGHWDNRTACTTCAVEWNGPQCLLQCPRGANGLQCSGRGTCHLTDCTCESDATRGFWTGVSCAECQYGYFGASCLSECPGGACSPCSGHGSCADGRLGSGLCTCVNNVSSVFGLFGGAACDLCVAGYYGLDCKSRCPLSANANNNLVVCGGRGVCDDGLLGSGLCTCFSGFAINTSTTTTVVNKSCTVCAPGYYGPNCTRCPTTTPQPCSGHGTCADGIAGSGVCTCSLGYAGTNCSFMCPVAENRTCNYGVCVGNLTCACDAKFARSPDGTCSSCVAGFYGAGCAQVCPLCERGTCSATGGCACPLGYWGALCQNQCPGGSSSPCSGHGACDTTTGQCSCFNNATRGYFQGVTCSACQPAYASTTCRIACPYVNGNLCNGRGTCFNGQCSGCHPLANESTTVVAVCGTSCQLRDAACFNFVNNCTTGLWGPTCSLTCPGTASNFSTTCSGKGICDPDAGVCLCYGGYYSDDCSLSCDTTLINGSLVPCSGRGACAGTNCACYTGYYGASCEGVCPGGAATPCNGRGTCSASGYCACDGSAYGAACDLPCPGGFELPCSNNGICTTSGACSCFNEDPLVGFYGGTDCSVCAGRYSGTYCNVTCPLLSGAIVGKLCVCSHGFVGVDCSIACPRTDNGVCDGHGTCRQVADAAVCTCQADFYGHSCDAHCTVAICSALGLSRAQCNTNTGACECLQSAVNGYFAGELCDDCVGRWWGPECNLYCPCSSHGVCARYTGVCSCDFDEGNGFWKGTYCDSCASGFIGTQCLTKNVEMSTASSSIASVTNAGYPNRGMLFVDIDMGVMLVGSNPISVVDIANVSKAMPLVSIPLTTTGAASSLSVAVLARVLNSTHLRLLCLTAGSNRAFNVVLPRGKSALIALGGGVAVATASTSRRGFAALADTTGVALSATDAASDCVATAFSGASDVFVLCDSSGFTASLVANTTEITWLGFVGELLVVSGRYVDPTQNGTSASTGWQRTAFNTSTTSWDVAFMSNFVNHTFDACSIDPITTNCDCAEASFCTAAHNSATHMICVWINGPGKHVVVARVFLATGAVDAAVAPLLLSGVQATAIAADGIFGTVILAAHLDNTPSTVYRLNAHTLVLTTAFDVPFSSADAPRVVQLSVNATNRILYMSVATSLSVQMMSLNLFGVKTISPNVLDLRGGATVTVTGEGFSALETYTCLFGASAAEFAAVRVNETTLECVAPPATEETTKDVCQGVNFNLKIGTRVTDVSYVPLYRPVSATPALAVTNWGTTGYGTALAATRITLTGYGFMRSATAACKLVGGGSGSDSANLTYFVTQAPVEYLNTTAVVCAQPALPHLPSKPPAFVYYSHDGTTYSFGGAPYAMVGNFSRFVLHDAQGLAFNASVTIAADTRSHIPLFHVRSADVYGNVMGPLDASTRPIRCSGIHPLILVGGVPELSTWTNDTTLTTSMVSGRATLNNVYLSKPLVGTLTVYCFDSRDFANFDSFTIQIVQGAPFALKLLTATQSWLIGVQYATTLSPNPKVVVVDVAGNVIADKAGLPSSVQLSYEVQTPNALTGERMSSSNVVVATPDEIGQYELQNVVVRTAFDVAVSFVFVAGDGVQTLIVSDVRQQSCVSGSEYAVTGAFTCASCPDYGICDGTSIVNVVPGTWRANQRTFTFYACDPADACPKSTTCADGYEGPLCGSCATGYGKSGVSCLPCLSDATNYGATAGLLVALVVLIYVLSIHSMPFSSIEDRKLTALNDAAEEQRKQPFPILFKILLSHFQVLGVVPYRDLVLPNWVSSFFTTSKSGSTFNPNLSFVSCAIDDGAEARLWITVLQAPILTSIIAVLSIFFAHRANVAFVEEQTKDRESDVDPDGRAKRTRYAAHPVSSQAADMMYIEQHYNAEHRLEVMKSHAQLLEWPTNNSNAEGALAASTEEGGFASEVSPMSKKSSRSSNNNSNSRATDYDYMEDQHVTADDLAAERLDEHYLKRQKSSFALNATKAKYMVGDGAGTTVEFVAPTLRPPPLLIERWFNMVFLAINVILFFLYPSIVQSCIDVLQCKTLDMGPAGSVRILIADPSVDCDDPHYQQGTLKMGVIFLAAFGLGTPIVSPLLVLAVRFLTCQGDMQSAKQIFFFATGGYRVWFWEGISLTRKAMIVVAVALVPKGEVRTLAVAWVLLLALGINAAAEPWEERPLFIVENVSFATLTATFSLLTFLYFPAIADDDATKTAVLAIMMGINFACFAFFASAFVWALRKHLLELAKTDPRLMSVYTALFHRSVERLVADNDAVREEIADVRAIMEGEYPHALFTAEAETEMELDVAVYRYRCTRKRKLKNALESDDIRLEDVDEEDTPAVLGPQIVLSGAANLIGAAAQRHVDPSSSAVQLSGGLRGASGPLRAARLAKPQRLTLLVGALAELRDPNFSLGVTPHAASHRSARDKKNFAGAEVVHSDDDDAVRQVEKTDEDNGLQRLTFSSDFGSPSILKGARKPGAHAKEEGTAAAVSPARSAAVKRLSFAASPGASPNAGTKAHHRGGAIEDPFAVFDEDLPRAESSSDFYGGAAASPFTPHRTSSIARTYAPAPLAPPEDDDAAFNGENATAEVTPMQAREALRNARRLKSFTIIAAARDAKNNSNNSGGLTTPLRSTDLTPAERRMLWALKPSEANVEQWEGRIRVIQLLTALANFRALSILMPLEILRLNQLSARPAAQQAVDGAAAPDSNGSAEGIRRDMRLNFEALMKVEIELFTAWLDAVASLNNNNNNNNSDNNPK